MKKASELLNVTNYTPGDVSSCIACPDCGKFHGTADLLKMYDLGLEDLIACDCKVDCQVDCHGVKVSDLTYVGEKPPIKPKIGDLVINYNTHVYSVWDGSVWMEITAENYNETGV